MLIHFFLVTVSLSCYNKFQRLGRLNNKQLLFTFLEAEESKIKVVSIVVPGKGHASLFAEGSLIIISSHGGEKNHSLVSFLRGALVLFLQAPPS